MNGCTQIAWAGSDRRAFFHADEVPASQWYGSLPSGQRDQSGQVYMRNRYYDPGIGQFTQQDPIGLADGLNLYGFANGDPINFSDPFGLCPPGDIACSWLEAGFTALGSVAGFVIGGGGGTLVAALTGGLGTVAIPAGAWQGAALGAAAGLAVGKLFSSSQGSSSSEGGSSASRYKEPASGKSGAEAATDVPSWAQGNRPMVGESGKDFAKRLLDQKYGAGQWKGTGPGSEYNKIKKWGDRGFVDPK